MKHKIEEIRHKTKKLHKKRVYVEEWHRPPSVSGNWIPELLDAAGAVGLGNGGDPSRPITY